MLDASPSLLTEIKNVGERGAKARQDANWYVIMPLCLLVLIAVIYFNLTPAIVHIPITAVMVTEYEARTHFCVAKGILPNETCQRPGLSRSMAIGVPLACAFLAVLPTVAIALIMPSCDPYSDLRFWQQLLPLGYLFVGATCGP